MSYRKLIIDDIEYKYSIGKKNVKIVTPEKVIAPLVSDIGFRFNYYTEEYLITPKMIRDFIKNEKKSLEHYVSSCEHDNRSLVYNPFHAEIHQKYYPIFVCKDCYNSLAADI